MFSPFRGGRSQVDGCRVGAEGATPQLGKTRPFFKPKEISKGRREAEKSCTKDTKLELNPEGERLSLRPHSACWSASGLRPPSQGPALTRAQAEAALLTPPSPRVVPELPTGRGLLWAGCPAYEIMYVFHLATGSSYGAFIWTSSLRSVGTVPEVLC